MAAINDKVYQKVREKAKEHHLTEQEINVIDKARQQLNSHTSMGGFVGASTAFLIGKRKKFNPIQLLALAGGGFLMGSQVGLISGALAGVNTIKTLPNPQRLVNVIREVQLETVNEKVGSSSPNTLHPKPIQHTTSSYSSMSSHQQSQVDDSFASEDLALHGDYTKGGSEFQTDRAVQLQQENGWQTNTNQQQQSSVYNQLRQQPQTKQPSKWDEIRSGNLPNTAWAKIRQEAAERRTDAKSIEQAKANRVAQLKEREAGFDDLPRTREEAERRISGRRNQWGDMIS
ncbi:uncharacterized protein BX664DRAFT_335036 [Halteromyces radiatus]|uniref:uncharacterized protein n=1 Tax=Halteromyces radiatus TaxID=101107 RepID=UPI002220AB75|nr:uncharacterized protein BX664DRAFT_335036 [Halteromyces radiatus]KAI8086150.1 hypothetical protein BX664DRAFT_335036 [Halteromyces radiatus]